MISDAESISKAVTSVLQPMFRTISANFPVIIAFVFVAPRVPVRAPGAIVLNVLYLA